MREKLEGRTLVNGVLGAAVTVALLPLPAVHFVAPLIGGMVAANLQDGGVRGGVKASLVMVVAFVIPTFAVFFGVPPSAPTESPIGGDPVYVYYIVGGASVWALVLGVAGGYMGGGGSIRGDTGEENVEVGDDAEEPEATGGEAAVSTD